MKKALQPSNKAYEEWLANKTLVKFGAINPGVNAKEHLEFSTQRMGVDNFQLDFDGISWHYKTDKQPSSYDKNFEGASENEKFSMEKLESDSRNSQEEEGGKRGLLQTRLEYLKASASYPLANALLVSHFWQTCMIITFFSLPTKRIYY